MRVGGVVLAAGAGQRFGSPKQFARLGAERVVDRAVRLLVAACDPVLVALPAGTGWDGDHAAAAVVGGTTRVGSVANAVAAVRAAWGEDDGVFVVHDSIRPLATAEQLAGVVAAVQSGADGALVAAPLADTLKRIDADGTLHHVGREGYVVAHGPFAYRLSMLERVIAELGTELVEESVGVERLGGRLVLVPGDRWSHHLVEPADLERFGRLL
jgi:2-C-methyl-D-erythritol 4-phosphate cytidylyltransferase